MAWNALGLAEIVMGVPVVPTDEGASLTFAHGCSFWTQSDVLLDMKSHRIKLLEEKENFNLVANVFPIGVNELSFGRVSFNFDPLRLRLPI